ncbi:MAG TPA: hypothetical protein VJN64_01570 [Terriglobales bacterium]|nr:hypothetical protein [Terriglobales bacterium]
MGPNRKATLILTMFFACALVPSLSAQQTLEPDQLPLSSSASAHGGYLRVPPRLLGPNPATAAVAAALAPDTVATFSGSYVTGPVTARQHWSFTMIGHGPSLAATTTINAPIIPVSLDLRNADGTPRFVNGHRLFYDVTPFIAPLLASPMFQNAIYSSSSRATQFQDAVQRAEFFHSAPSGWHTLLKPVVKAKRVMTLLAGSYKFATKSDGSCCAYVLVDSSTFVGKLLPPSTTDTKTVVGAALHAGNITTKDLATFFFPNTFLFSGTQNFFIVGFHTFLSEPGNTLNGNRQKQFVLNFSSWVTPFVFFGDAFQDVTAVSHEVAESVNDPFLGNTTPWWKAPNGQCQNVLETGDVVEDLPNATFPVVLKGKAYHPQNEALLEWFERQKPSHALGAAYSYPDEKLLISLSPLEKPGCP